MPDSSNSPVISSDARVDGLADGVLIDITCYIAKSYGLQRPFAVSDALYHGYVEPPADLEALGQSLKGRFHDLLPLANVADRRGMGESRAS
ncbi:hypothetical protein JCM15519_20960 [Fundidesulfovibrio butyratiphilus]